MAFRTTTYLLVVVQNGIHVLDPYRVDGPVEDEPLAIGRLRRGERAITDGEHAVGPLVRDGIESAVELAHRYRLGIDDGDDDFVLLHQPLLEEIGQRAGENAIGGRLSAERLADDHEPVSNDHHLVDLKYLRQKDVGHLEIHSLAIVLDRLR